MKNTTKYKNFTQRLLGLISEPNFIKFENILSEPNFFKIVGRTHFERWHSCFIGWLLDTNGSHLLKDYTLFRFLYLLLDDQCLKPEINANYDFLSKLPMFDFDNIEVTPNEFIPNETSIKGVGRFDIFLTAKYTDSLNETGNLNIIFELKIDSKPNGEQSKKYADWLLSNHPNDINLLIYLTPNLLSSSKATVGDKRWYCLDYQLLNDKLLNLLLDHPNINEKVKPFIIQYIKNLKIRYKGIKMAITEEEKKLAIALYDKYSDVFDSIYDALVSTGTIDFTTSEMAENKGRATGKIAVKIDKKIFVSNILRELFKDVLKYIIDKNYIDKIPLPWGKSSKRYIITNEIPPIHPNGRDFFYPEQYKDYTIETHYARERGLKVLDDLCNKLEIEFEIIEV